MSYLRVDYGTVDGSLQGNSEVPSHSHPWSVVASKLRGCFSVAQRSAWENGIICASIACVIFSFSSLQVKLTGGRVPVLQLCIIRSSISFCTSVLSGRAAGIKPLFGHREHFPLLLTRGFFGTLAISTSYVALLTLPLGDAVTIAQMRPPVTAVMARFLLGEPLGVQGFMGCLVSVAGVVILAHPPFLMGGHSDWSQKRMLGTLCGVASTLCASGTSYAIRKIGKKEPALTVALWFHTTTISLMVWPLLAGIPEAAKLVAWKDCLLLLGIATTSFFAQLLMTRSFQILAAARAAAVSFTGVIYSHILGALIFHERLTPATAGGGVLIFLGVILVTLRSDDSSKSSNAPAAGKLAEPGSQPAGTAAAAAAALGSAIIAPDSSPLLPGIATPTQQHHMQMPEGTFGEAAAGLQRPVWLQRLLPGSRHIDGISSKVAYQPAASQELAWTGRDSQTGGIDVDVSTAGGSMLPPARHAAALEQHHTEHGPFAVQQPQLSDARFMGSLNGLGSEAPGMQGPQGSGVASGAFDPDQVQQLRGQSPSWASWASWRSSGSIRQDGVLDLQQLPQQQPQSQQQLFPQQHQQQQ